MLMARYIYLYSLFVLKSMLLLSGVDRLSVTINLMRAESHVEPFQPHLQLKHNDMFRCLRDRKTH